MLLLLSFFPAALRSTHLFAYGTPSHMTALQIVEAYAEPQEARAKKKQPPLIRSLRAA